MMKISDHFVGITVTYVSSFLPIVFVDIAASDVLKSLCMNICDIIILSACLIYVFSHPQHIVHLFSLTECLYIQAMMKDQFANYVVQKVLETCDDQQRELILSRIKVHLNALKKYTYGKHIVARVEKLVAAGGTHSSFCLLIFIHLCL